MDLTPSLPSSPAGNALPLSPDASSIERSESEIRAAIQRVLDETTKSTGKPIRSEDLLAHLLREPGSLGREALLAAGVTPERLRAELLRLAGHPDDAQPGRPTGEHLPWPVSRWACLAVLVSVIAYPLSIGPVLLMADRFDMGPSVEGALEIVYFPIIWLYDAVPWVKVFYDWYLETIGFS